MSDSHALNVKQPSKVYIQTSLRGSYIAWLQLAKDEKNTNTEDIEVPSLANGTWSLASKSVHSENALYLALHSHFDDFCYSPILLLY